MRSAVAALLLTASLVSSHTAFAQLSADDVKWINQCIADNKGGAKEEVVRKYCMCMNEKMSDNETKSITQWEKTHAKERVACDREAGWKRSNLTQDAGPTRVESLLKETGLAYTTHDPTTWSIEFNRANIGNTRVILVTSNDILVTFVILAKKANIERTPQMMEALLIANYDYDYAKIGLDKDGDMFVRIDSPLKRLDATELKQIVEQVANASDGLYLKISPWVKK